MSGHTCDVPRCDGTKLGHDLAVEFPEATRQVDEALDRLRHRRVTPATGTALTDTGRPYPVCGDHTTSKEIGA